MSKHGKTAILSEIFFFKIPIKFWHQIYVHSRGLDENKGGLWRWNPRPILCLMLSLTQKVASTYTFLCLCSS